MAEDDDEKTEDPSGKRLDEARSKGNVLKSPELKNAFSLAGTLFVVMMGLPLVCQHVIPLLRMYLASPDSIAADGTNLGFVLLKTLGSVAIYVAVPVGILMGLGLASNWLQTGFYFSPEVFKFDFNRVNPVAGFKKLFSANALVELLKSVVKLIILGIITVHYIRPVVENNSHFAGLSLPSLLVETNTLATKMVMAVTVAVAGIAIADYVYQRYVYMKRLKMTKQEVKDEYKNAEGDPKIKGKLRAMRQQKARQRMMAMVPKSDVVITNPTHFAIALEYKPEMMQAPIVRAKGADLMAKRIRDLATENNVPLIENPPLARALYASAEVDNEIPAEHYKAVAEVISYVFKLRGKKVKPITVAPVSTRREGGDSVSS